MVTAVREPTRRHIGGEDVAYYLTPYLARIQWKDGSRVYCRPCDQETPMNAVSTPKGIMLRCGQGHDTHPLNVIVTKGNE